MITRIVKMEFNNENTSDFLSFFDGVSDQISNFSGCQGMTLMKDIKNPNIIFTYSKWDNHDSLENYRKSDLFLIVWPKVKQWFSNKPEAWSLESHYDGFKQKKG